MAEIAEKHAVPIVFEGFALDLANRELRRGDERVEVSGRYFDVLALLASRPGQLITKQQFMDEVWRGVPVTDEALTQAIRSLRRELGDEAGKPRFIETVPRHGYRFIAPVEGGAETVSQVAPTKSITSRLTRTIWDGTLGALMAGLVIGAFYGLLAASGSSAAGSALSTVLVMMAVCAVCAAFAGAGITGAVAAMHRYDSRLPAVLAAGAVGGAITGALGQMLALDAFRLLAGVQLGTIAGPLEGVVLGTIIAAGIATASSQSRLWWPAILVVGALGALAVHAAGGAMMVGSLASLAEGFFAEGGARVAPDARPALVMLEGALFCAGCSAGAARLRLAHA